MRQVNQATLNLIESFEGCVLHPYLDSKGIPTIGIGTILYPDGKHVTMQDAPISQDRAYELLQWQVGLKCTGVEHLVHVSLNDNQFGALVSFAYNLGLGALQSSTLLRKVNEGDFEGAAEEFLKWDHAGGVRVAGLTRRRQAERSLFLQPI